MIFEKDFKKFALPSNFKRIPYFLILDFLDNYFSDRLTQSFILCQDGLFSTGCVIVKIHLSDSIE